MKLGLFVFIYYSFRVYKALDLGCGRGYLSSIVDGDDIKELYQCELSSQLLNRVLPSKISNTKSFHMDEEKIEFEKDFFDLG